MSHNTTSWKSHSSTWRWTAGNDGRSPEGGKAYRVGRRPALTRQKTVGQHHQREMPMQPIPTPALVVIQTTLALGILVELLDGPAAVRQFDQPWQWGIRGQGTEIPFDLTACAWHRPLAQQPALGSRADAVMAGGELRAARRPVPAHGDELFAQAPLVVLAPGDRLPTICGQGFEHGFGCIQRGRTRLLRLATAPRTRRRHGGGHTYLVWQAHPKSTADTDDVSHLSGVEACQEGRIVAVARVGHDPGERHHPGPRLVPQRERQLGLCLQGDLGRHMDLAPAGRSG